MKWYEPWQSALTYGADYFPEQWLDRPEILEEDIRYMKEAGVNFLSIGMFAWTFLEPSEGDYQFDWLEEVIDRLGEAGINVALATPSGAMPAWMAKKYPEIMRVSADRTPDLYGQRHNHCYTSPVYREKVAAINERLAARFSEKKNVICWHVSNEYGGDCHCELCQAAFRAWLKERYGTLEALNHAWWNAFWSHSITDWEQIESPSPQGEPYVHGLNLDWHRFVTERTVDFYRYEVRAIRRGEKRFIPATHNFHDFVHLDRGYDYWELAPHMEIIAWDNYPMWHYPGRAVGATAARTALIHDINRSLAQGNPFLMLESSPSATNWQEVAKLRRPGQTALQGMQAIAHGANSVSYFQWRKSLGSSEKFHGAVLDHCVTDEARVFKEVRKLGQDLQKLRDIAPSRVKAEVAIVYDWENHWAYYDSQGPMYDKPSLMDVTTAHYEALWQRGIPCDVIDQTHELDDYRLLIFPLSYLLRDGFPERVRGFVARGGTAVTSCWSGIVDKSDLCFTQGRPGPLREVFGIWAEETEALYPETEVRLRLDEGAPVAWAEEIQTVDLVARRLFDLCHLDDEQSRVWLRLGEDFYEGMPALIEHNYGEGLAFYQATLLEQDVLQAFYDELIGRLDLRKASGAELPQDVTVTRRVVPADEAGAGKAYLFFQNFSDEAHEIAIPEGGQLILEDRDLAPGASVTLPAYGYLVVACEDGEV